MAFVTLLSRDSSLRGLLTRLPGLSTGAVTRSPGRLLRLVRERPVTVVVVDSAVFESEWEPEATLREVSSRFPSVGTVFVARSDVSPVTLLQLGRAGIAGLHVLPHGEVWVGFARSLARASADDTRGRTLRRIGQGLSAWERGVTAMAIDAALLGWSADELAAHVGWTRAHLGVRLGQASLPSPGQLLLWARVLHAARWLPEPGRTGQSIARQLDYANGSTFRRALRSTLGRTPSEIVVGGGFELALEAFLDLCGVADSVGDRRSVA